MLKLKQIITICIAVIMVTSAFAFPEEADAASFSKAAVKNLKVSSYTYNSVKLSWSKKVGTTKYQVYRATSKNGKYKKVATTSKNYYKNTNLTTGKTYYYKVRAYKKSGSKYTYSKYSSKIKAYAKLNTPTAKLLLTNNSPKVSWNKISGAKGYQIYRAVKGGTYKKIKTTTNCYYTDTSAQDGRRYYYKVRAYRTVKGSYKYSSFSSAKYTSTKLSTPTVTLEPATDSITLSWSKIPYASKYQVYRCNDNGTYEKIATIASTTFVDSTNLSSSTTYSYKVRAYRYIDGLYNYGSYSAAKSCQLTTPSVPNEPVDVTMYYIDYNGVNLHLNQDWTDSLNAKLNVAAGGSGAVAYTAERISNTTDKSVYAYCYDTVDYDNFLIVYVSEDKVIGWKTNADVAGVYNGTEIITNEAGSNYDDFLYDTENDNADVLDLTIASVITWNEAFDTDANLGTPISFAQNDTVIAGIEYTNLMSYVTTSIEQEEIIAEHMINALRATHGVNVLEHNDALYGNEEYGTKAYAKTMAMSNVCSHKAEDLTTGPLAGMSATDRQLNTAEVCGYEVVPFGENASGDNVTTVGGGENLAWAWYTSSGHKETLLEFGPDTALQGYSEVCYMAVAGYATDSGRAFWAFHNGEKPL